jgi:hypothetical protein
MKKFIRNNWYKMMIGSSLLMASFGFMIFSINTVNAKSQTSMYSTIPVNADGSISVRLSDEQLNKIIPKNEDGSISIKLSEQQLKALEPSDIQAVNIVKLNGWNAGIHWSYNLNGEAYYSLDVTQW